MNEVFMASDYYMKRIKETKAKNVSKKEREENFKQKCFIRRI